MTKPVFQLDKLPTVGNDEIVTFRQALYCRRNLSCRTKNLFKKRHEKKSESNFRVPAAPIMSMD